MNSNNIIIKMIYYAGIASCAAQGAEKGKYKERFSVMYYIANAFGGGFMRDVIFLEVYPWMFTLSALPDIALVVFIGSLYTYYFFICKANKKQNNIAMRCVTIADAFGVGSFICIGMDKAFDYSSNVFTIIVCGYVTAIGGGILASGKQLTKIFKSRETICYHLVTLLGCCYYYIFRHGLLLVCFTTIGLLLTTTNYRTMYNICFCNLTTLYLEVLLLYPAICNGNNKFRDRKFVIDERRLSFRSERSKIYLVQHRIRQC